MQSSERSLLVLIQMSMIKSSNNRGTSYSIRFKGYEFVRDVVIEEAMEKVMANSSHLKSTMPFWTSSVMQGMSVGLRRSFSPSGGSVGTWTTGS